MMVPPDLAPLMADTPHANRDGDAFSRVLNGWTRFGGYIRPLLERLGPACREHGVDGLAKNEEVQKVASMYFRNTKPLDVPLSAEDGLFLTRTTVGKFIDKARAWSIKSFFREDGNITFENAVKVGLPVEEKALFKEFEGVPGFRKLFLGYLGQNLGHSTNWDNFITNLSVARGLKEKGFRVLEFEGRETGLDLGGDFTASVNPDIVVENEDGKYLVEVKGKGTKNGVETFYKHKACAYTQAERYVACVKQRDYAGVILGLHHENLYGNYPPNELVTVERKTVSEGLIHVFNVK